MTILDDLQKKLSEAQNEIESVTSELQEFAKIKESIHSTDMQIKNAANQLEELSRSLTSGASALEKASESLSKTNDIIHKTDPAELLKELTSISQKQKASEDEILSSIKSAETTLEGSMKSLGKSFQSKIDTGNENIEQQKTLIRESFLKTNSTQKTILGISILTMLIVVFIAIKNI